MIAIGNDYDGNREADVKNAPAVKGIKKLILSCMLLWYHFHCFRQQLGRAHSGLHTFTTIWCDAVRAWTRPYGQTRTVLLVGRSSVHHFPHTYCIFFIQHFSSDSSFIYFFSFFTDFQVKITALGEKRQIDIKLPKLLSSFVILISKIQFSK